MKMGWVGKQAKLMAKDDDPQRVERLARMRYHAEQLQAYTEEGHRWLIRMAVATLFVFGLKRRVGLDTISAFFSRLRLEHHVGCLLSSLRGVVRTLENEIERTTQIWEHDATTQSEGTEIIGAMDGTFLQRMILVFMDLPSGFC